MSIKHKPNLNFYTRKGSAFDAMHSKTLFYGWVVGMFLILEVVRLLLIVFFVSMDARDVLDFWNSPFLFGLDMAGTVQMLCILLAAYVFVHLGVFLTEPHRRRRDLLVGVSVHVFGIVIAVMYALAYGMLGPWLHQDLYGAG